MNNSTEPDHDIAHRASWSGLSDDAVIGAVIAGQTSLFEALVRRHNERLFRVGMGYLKSRMDVEDAMQDTYLKAFKNLRNFRGESAFATWLTKIMVNECLMRLRKLSATILERIENVSFERLKYFPSEEPMPDLDIGELKNLIERSVSRLPRNYRVVYLLRETQNLSTAETAKCLEISEQNVKVRLHRAREALKSLLMESAAVMDLFDYPATYCNPLTTRIMEAIARSK